MFSSHRDENTKFQPGGKMGMGNFQPRCDEKKTAANGISRMLSQRVSSILSGPLLHSVKFAPGQSESDNSRCNAEKVIINRKIS